VLRARAELAPPAQLITLIKGRPVPQLPLDRTPHVVSRAEATDDATDAVCSDDVIPSPMEREFNTQLNASRPLSQGVAPATSKPTRNRLPIPEAYLEELESTRDSKYNSK